MTPHLGASTAESEDNCAIMAVREIRDYLRERQYRTFCKLSGLQHGRLHRRQDVSVFLHKQRKGYVKPFIQRFLAMQESILTEWQTNPEAIMHMRF